MSDGWHQICLDDIPYEEETDYHFLGTIYLSAVCRGWTRCVPSLVSGACQVFLIICAPVVLLKSGPYQGKIAVIVEIIDHRRVSNLPHFSGALVTENAVLQAIVDGPTTGVPRQSFAYRHLTLTPLSIKLPRAARTGIVRKYVEKQGVVEKWYV